MPIKPTLPELLRDAMASRQLDTHTAVPARVKSYDRAKQTADCEVVIRHPAPVSDGSVLMETYAVIPNVPVAWVRGGGYWMQMPLTEGDSVQLVFNEADISRWRATGDVSDPQDLTRHDISYPVAYPCIAPDASALPAIGSDECVIDGPTTIRIGGAGAEALAIASKVMDDFNDLKTLFTTGWTPVPNDGGAALKTAFGSLVSAGWPTPIASTKLKGE